MNILNSIFIGAMLPIMAIFCFAQPWLIPALALIAWVSLKTNPVNHCQGEAE